MCAQGGERNNPCIIKAKKYVSHLRDVEDPLSPGPKFGRWGERSDAADANPSDWVTSAARLSSPASRSKSPAKGVRFPSPERYSYMSPMAAKQPAPEIEFDPYAEGVVTDVDMLPLFKLLDPSSLCNCPRKAAHARAEVFKFLRAERQGRLDALKAVNASAAELRKAKESLKKANALKAKAEKGVKDAQDEAATRIGVAEASEKVLKAKTAALEGHLVSVKGQLEGMRELNMKLQASLTQEREATPIENALREKLGMLEGQVSAMSEQLGSANGQLDTLRAANMKLQQQLTQEQHTVALMTSDADKRDYAHRHSSSSGLEPLSLPSGSMSPSGFMDGFSRGLGGSMSPMAAEDDRTLLQKLRVRACVTV